MYFLLPPARRPADGRGVERGSSGSRSDIKMLREIDEEAAATVGVDVCLRSDIGVWRNIEVTSFF